MVKDLYCHKMYCFNISGYFLSENHTYLHNIVEITRSDLEGFAFVEDVGEALERDIIMGMTVLAFCAYEAPNTLS